VGSEEASSEAFRNRCSHRPGRVAAPGSARHGDHASSRTAVSQCSDRAARL
jgi:hypothetical protein